MHHAQQRIDAVKEAIPMIKEQVAKEVDQAYTERIKEVTEKLTQNWLEWGQARDLKKELETGVLTPYKGNVEPEWWQFFKVQWDKQIGDHMEEREHGITRHSEGGVLQFLHSHMDSPADGFATREEAIEYSKNLKKQQTK